MSEHQKAQVTPFSSVVGSSVTLHDPETGRVIAQLSVLNTGGDTPEDWKQRQIAVADDVAMRINVFDKIAPPPFTKEAWQFFERELEQPEGEIDQEYQMLFEWAIRTRDALAKAGGSHDKE